MTRMLTVFGQSYHCKRPAQPPVKNPCDMEQTPVFSLLTLVAAVRVPSAAAATPSLSLHSPQGWRLDFAALPPAEWLMVLWAARA